MASKPVVVKNASSLNEIKASASGGSEKSLTNGYHDKLNAEDASVDSSRPSASASSSSSSSSTASSSSSSGEMITSKSSSLTLVDDDELKRMLSTQLEFYFSRENLLHDKYLLSQMDSDSYVPLVILASFNMIRKLFSSSIRFSTIANGKNFYLISFYFWLFSFC